MNICVDFLSRDITSNKNGISTTDEVVKQSEGGSISAARDDGTETSRLSLHMLSKCAYVTSSLTLTWSDA